MLHKPERYTFVTNTNKKEKEKVGATTWILHLNYQLVLHLIELNMDQIISVIKLSMEAKEHQLKSP